MIITLVITKAAKLNDISNQQKYNQRTNDEVNNGNVVKV